VGALGSERAGRERPWTRRSRLSAQLCLSGSAWDAPRHRGMSGGGQRDHQGCARSCIRKLWVPRADRSGKIQASSHLPRSDPEGRLGPDNPHPGPTLSSVSKGTSFQIIRAQTRLHRLRNPLRVKVSDNDAARPHHTPRSAQVGRTVLSVQISALFSVSLRMRVKAAQVMLRTDRQRPRRDRSTFRASTVTPAARACPNTPSVGRGVNAP
jgi:hypothetical protein